MAGRSTTTLRAATAALLAVAAALLGGIGPAQSATDPHDLVFSRSPDRTAPAPLEAATVDGDIFVFVSPESGIVQVRFYLDDPNRTGTPIKIEKNAPWDFAGTRTDDSAIGFDTTKLSEGAHTITAASDLSGGGTEIVTASFIVDNVAPPPPTGPGPPDQVHLAWVDDPATTLDVVWRTLDTEAPSVVEYRPVGASVWTTTTGGVRPSGTTGALHEVELTGLSPATSYEYRVPGNGGEWSPIFVARTAPPPGPADFDAVYVADTGIAGRADGLTTGTQQVIDEIASLRPTLVLPGGDYAYYNTETRYDTLDQAIDAWFNQMQPIAAYSPLLPVYGNHEAILGEGFAPWAARFPTPAGFDGRRNYSFDVGDVHFVAIFAVTETSDLEDDTVAWIEQDIEAAQGRGQRWIVPYFHVSPFSEGKNHPSNLALRAQLGPLFERLGVKVVLASHDQSYERTWPLVNVPAANTPTSHDPRCYTMADGVTWVKVSPGGKLSNKNGDFSQWASAAPPPWTAVRDNTAHHFARIRVSAAGSLRVDVYALRGDGSPAFVQDSFEYTTGACPDRMDFDPTQLLFTVEEGAPVEQKQARLSTTAGAAVAFSLTDDAPWLTVTPTSGSTPVDLSVSVDPTGLAPGTYHGTATASAAGYESETLNVSLTVTGSHELAVSTSANRSNAIPLDGATVSGKIYAFVRPESGVTRASFWLDNPAMSGSPRRTESTAPWDFAGGTVTTANAFDTGNVADGAHTITVALDLADGGRTIVDSTFTVANAAPPPPPPPPPPPSGTTHELLVSTSSTRAAASPLDGATVSGNVYVFTAPETDTKRVRFWLDDPNRTKAPRKTESNGPWDFAGTNKDDTAIAYDTRKIADGSHVITAEVTRSDGSIEVIHGAFTVLNSGG